MLLITSERLKNTCLSFLLWVSLPAKLNKTTLHSPATSQCVFLANEVLSLLQEGSDSSANINLPVKDALLESESAGELCSWPCLWTVVHKGDLVRYRNWHFILKTRNPSFIVVTWSSVTFVARTRTAEESIHNPDNRTDWPADRPSDQPTDWPADWPTDQTIDRPDDRPTDWPTGWPTDRPIDRLADRPTNWLTDRPTDWLNGRQTD